MLNISDYFGFGCKGHENFNFVDVDLSDDIRLFIDPLLIEGADDPWSREANAVKLSLYSI